MAEAIEGYTRVASLLDLPDGACTAVEVNGQSLVLIRRGDTVTTLDNRCPHAGAPLSEGFVEGRQVTCAWHGFTFDVVTGESADQTGLTVPTHETRVEGGEVLVRI